ncbi:hypothetical protein [Rhizobium sp. CECT 9324]|uniref:hypothetical protein n=1 Tax=Rhizobium sp. CECT 9324 TaxID=2845820 RepID=UPI001E617113|nr:hypothetical protein [Rhizobium sp. CECT 9324]CAH0339049.1 hypothetical protein RHI9324_00688 [Rhizobium sp. CECT 9324]
MARTGSIAGGQNVGMKRLDATQGLDHLIDLDAEVFEPGALQPWRTSERDDDPVEAGAAAEKPAYQTALTSVLPAMKMMMNEPGVQSAARIS